MLAKLRGARSHLTYANVMSTLAVFFVLAGGTALAAKSGSTVVLVATASKSVSVPAGGSATLNESCPQHAKILGGGAHFDNSSGTLSASTMNFNRNPITWKAAGTNHGSSAQDLHVLVICQSVG